MNILNLIDYAWDTTNSEELIKLSKHRDWRVRQAVAKNKRTPGKLLKILTCDNGEVRRSAELSLKNREAARTQIKLIKLAESSKAKDRIEAVKHPLLPFPIFRTLYHKDKSKKVQHMARLTFKRFYENIRYRRPH